MHKFSTYVSVFVLMAMACLAQARDVYADPTSESSLTIYSNADPISFDPQTFISQQVNGNNTSWSSQVPGFGVVKELRTLDLQSGMNEVKFTDVAQFIDPTTVSFSDLTDPTTAIHEQNFQFDLANSEKVLNRYIDKQIGVVIDKGNSFEEIKGTLISAAGSQLVLKTADGVQLVNRNGPQIKLGELPGGLITKPTLVWKIATKQGGKHQVRTTYQTAGITWRSDYNLVLNEKETAADIGAWVTLMNLSGMEFKDTALKLIAGDVQRVTQNNRAHKAEFEGARVMALEDVAGFTEKEFFEYHLYSLPRRVDVKSNATQQITLFPTAKDVRVEKLLVYYGLPEASGWNFWNSPQTDRNLGTQSNPKLDVYLRFKNDAANNMGMPFPRGKMRVYKQDSADGTLEFIGEDLIDHTPRDAKVMIKLGQSFDVVGCLLYTSPSPRD